TARAPRADQSRTYSSALIRLICYFAFTSRNQKFSRTDFSKADFSRPEAKKDKIAGKVIHYSGEDYLISILAHNDIVTKND
ncbi:10350_t:CDS:2, partial [Dentiscutata heterogama]